MSKKGQTEMIGLVIIMLLLLAIGIVFIKFSVSGKDDNLYELRTNIETANLLKAMLKVDADGMNIGDMIIECENDNAKCNKPRQIINDIMNKALKPGSSYKFIASAENRDFLDLGSCETEGIFSSQPYVRQGVYVDNKLKICK